MSVIHVGTVTSTNDVARQGLLDGAQHGTAWRADRQTAGRGRHGNDWVSREGDLFMSIALRPRLDAADLPLVTLAAAVGAQAAVASEGVDCGLKWPNDLILSGLKLGGILCESVISGDKPEGCVVGVGINVSLDPTELPPPLDATATSFAHLGASLPDLERLAEAVRNGVVAMVDRLTSDPDFVLNTWRARNTTLGRNLSFEHDGETRVGTAVELADDGGLVVEVDGQRVTVRSGQVVLT